jgi:hypothetical protein
VREGSRLPAGQSGAAIFYGVAQEAESGADQEVQAPYRDSVDAGLKVAYKPLETAAGPIVVLGLEVLGR